MDRSPLFDKLISAGGVPGEYGGAQTAASFGDARAEFLALQQGCGVFDLGWRAKLVATGADRVRWFNGMVTNNIRDLAVDRGTYNFLLNAQGRIQGDMYVYNRGEYIVADTDRAQANPLLEAFEKFIIMDEVEVGDAGEQLTAIGVAGPQAPQVLQAAGLWPGEMEPLSVRDAVRGQVGLSVVRKEAEFGRCYELWMSSPNAPEIWDALAAAGARPVGSEALELRRIALGIPRYGQDIRERDLPQETEQYRALHFQKGCYVGQEIVERIHARGLLHRVFTGFAIDGPPPPAGAKFEIDGRTAGEITSVARLPIAGDGEKTVALGYVRREVGPPGATFQVDGARATVLKLPFEIAYA